MWGELSSECGASCLGASFLWGELSWGELSLGRVVLIPCTGACQMIGGRDWLKLHVALLCILLYLCQ